MSESDFGPMPSDQTNIGGVPSTQNPDQTDTSGGEVAPPPQAQAPPPSAKDLPRGYVAKRKRKIQFGGGEPEGAPSMAPVEQHSPTKVHVPGWRVIVLGGSGGLKKRLQ